MFDLECADRVAGICPDVVEGLGLEVAHADTVGDAVVDEFL